METGKKASLLCNRIIYPITTNFSEKSVFFDNKQGFFVLQAKSCYLWRHLGELESIIKHY